MLKVTLLYHTPEPEKVVAAAAKLCYSASGVDGVLDHLNEEKTTKFLEMLASLGHQSPIEHASFTFGIEGVSRSLLAQITRHRMASFSVKSQRYVTENQFEYIIPPEIEHNMQAREIYEKSMQSAQESYNQLADILEKQHLAALLLAGLSEKEAQKQAEKMAIEDARYVLPNACETKMIVTMNARSLYNFFSQRCCNRAQWEIRALATEMLRLCLAVAPTLFGGAGPSCASGACSEGKMSCKKAKEMRESILKLKEDAKCR